MRAGRYPENHPLERKARQAQYERALAEAKKRRDAGNPDATLEVVTRPASEPRKRW